MDDDEIRQVLSKIKGFILMLHNDISNVEGSLSEEYLLAAIDMCVDYITFIQSR